MTAKRHAKTSMGVDYALRKLVREPLAKQEDVPDFAEAFLMKIHSKGIILPDHLKRALDCMSKRSATEAASTDGTAP